MSDQFVAEIRIFGCNFAPLQWGLCNGQILPISQNTALFSLIGTFYGGNGTSNFALPNLQGNVPLQQGQGPGLSLYDLGETGGEQAVTLLTTEIPSHTHMLKVDTAAKKESATLSNGTPAGLSSGASLYSTAASNVSMNANTLSSFGGSQPHDNMQPYLALNFCIALSGVYPSRS